jgi:hypothetical protein
MSQHKAQAVINLFDADVCFFFLQESNVKRDIKLGASESQFIHKVLRKLGVKDHVVKAAKATLISRNTKHAQGFILVSTDKISFYAESSFGFQKKHLRIFFKDIISVATYGEKLSLIVAVEQGNEDMDRTFERTTSKFLQGRGESGDISGKPSSGRSQSRRVESEQGSKLMLSSFSNSTKIMKPRAKDVYIDIHEYGMTSSVGCTDNESKSNVSIHFSLPVENESQHIKCIISDRIREIKKSMLNRFIPDFGACSFQETQQESVSMFGYQMPGEILDAESKEAISQIFSHAKSCTYNHGDEVVRRGCVERKLFHIVSGIAALTCDAGQVTAKLGAGEIFNEYVFLDSGDSGAESVVVAEGTLKCLVVVRDTVEMMGELHPAAAARFWRSRAVEAAFRLRLRGLALDGKSLGREAHVSAVSLPSTDETLPLQVTR